MKKTRGKLKLRCTVYVIRYISLLLSGKMITFLSQTAVSIYSLQSISHQFFPTHPPQILVFCASWSINSFLGFSYKRADWSKKNFEEMQQMEEGTKLIQVDPDSKTPYSDVTQVSFYFILTFEKPFLTIFQ